MPHGSGRAPSWQVGGGKRGILLKIEFDVSNTPNNNTVYTDMCAFSHDSLTLGARALACVGSACPWPPAGKAAPLPPSAATHAPGPLLAPWRGSLPHCGGSVRGGSLRGRHGRRAAARLLRARPLRRARAAHWSAPCLGSLQRKRSLAMRMRRSFMSSFSFSKSNWPRSISGEEIGGRICSGSSSK